MEQAQVVMLLVPAAEILKNREKFNIELEKLKNRFPQKQLLVVINKIDMISEEEASLLNSTVFNSYIISAKSGKGVDELKEALLQFVNTGVLRNNETIVTNSRHYDALLKALEEIQKVQEAIDDGISGDLMAIDIRQALYYFGEITGEISNDELLGNIFANFCIGK